MAAKQIKTAKHVTLSVDLIAQLEAEASVEHVTVSELVESHLRQHYQGSDVRPDVERLAHQLNAFQAAVMPVVMKVAFLIQQFEQEVPGSTPAPPPMPIATYETMYDSYKTRG